MASLAEPRYTPEQYLALEREAAYKSEYINGYIYAMAGASLQHNQITFNIAREMGKVEFPEPDQTGTPGRSGAAPRGS